jgi:hypothetical protein
MSELAFNQNGDLFDVPAVVTGWRVRRLKPRGAPELVYARDGRPLTISIEADMNELREAVGGVLGKYRLDPVDDDGKVVADTQPAYVQVVKAEQLSPATTASTRDEGDSVIRDAMRLNTELAKSVIDRFPEMMHAAAELLRAADGAGLPARQPRETDDDKDGDDEVATAPSSSPAFEFINTLVAQVVPLVVSGIASKGMPKLGAILDWRKAAPEPKQIEPTSTAAAKPAPSAKPVAELPPLDPKAMSHFIAIQSALTPAEAALARQIAGELSPTEMRTWFGELSAMSVSDAVAKIRTFIEKAQRVGGVS